MAKPPSAGLLMYRESSDGVEVFIAHPGGPYWSKKDAGAWTLPKGLAEPDDDDLLAVARREFEEETGLAPPTDRAVYVDLGEVTLKSRKRVRAWAFAGEWPDGRELRSNTFEIEWPPRSGERRTFPEIDRVEWFAVGAARGKLNPAQVAFVDRLEAALGGA